MKQVFQSLDTGETMLIDVPRPASRPGHLLIHTRATVISAGTERMLVAFGRANAIQKARQQPDKVRKVLDKVRADGLAETLSSVQKKLSQPIPMGYCQAGVVIDVGEGVTGFAVGDRVASNGPHAEFVSVPVNLCAQVPDHAADLSNEAVAFTALGAIALQGIRLATPTLGERFAVTGLGLVGLLTVQLLQAHGCHVIGIDPNPQRVKIAAKLGAETVDLYTGQDPLTQAARFSRGQGLDGVFVTASTPSSRPIRQAAQMCRKRGRVVMVGVTGMELSRDEFYEKELSLQVSCSYGPGRYDPAYEAEGHDYPLPYVRWTEGRNFQAVLDTMADGRLQVDQLITHRFPLSHAEEAYALLAGDDSALGTVLENPAPLQLPIGPKRRRERPEPTPDGEFPEVRRRILSQRTPRIGLIGAGDYAMQVLMPAWAKAGAVPVAVVSRAGSSAGLAQKRFGFQYAVESVTEVIGNPEIDLVVIATPHDTHAELAIAALQHGKHVFIEKPLTRTFAELEALQALYNPMVAQGTAPMLVVGFNRRYAPLVVKARSLLNAKPGPKFVQITVNARELPRGHWLRNPAIGGGRIVGEGCHFVDLARHLVGSQIIDVVALGLKDSSGRFSDSALLQLQFADGSLSDVAYVTNGHRRHPKERIQVFADGGVVTIDNYRRLWLNGRSAPRTIPSRKDKGHAGLVAATVEAFRTGRDSPTPWQELSEVTSVCVQAAEDLSAS